MRLSVGIPSETCANPQALDQNLNRANLYENERFKHTPGECKGRLTLSIPLRSCACAWLGVLKMTHTLLKCSGFFRV